MLVIAWGRFNVHELENEIYIAGMEFQVIPGGTMFNAEDALHGLIGYDAVLVGESEYEITGRNTVRLCGLRGTETQWLAGFEKEIVAAFTAERSVADC